MIWLFIAIIAQIILGTSAVLDKVLLKHTKINPAAYTFWLGLIGGFGFILLPFGGFAMSSGLIAIALLSGIFFIGGMLMLFHALAVGQASAVLPLIGALSAVSTFIFAHAFGFDALGAGDIAGFALLFAGGMLFYFSEKKEIRQAVVPFVLGAAVLFGFANITAKTVFDATSFIAGFSWIKIGGVGAAAMMLGNQAFRLHIIKNHTHILSRHRVWYLVNRFYAGIGSIIAAFAISLAHPALVDATQGFRYVIIFIMSVWVLRERGSRRHFFIKICALIVMIAGILWFGLVGYAQSIPVDRMRAISWYVTFSSKFSKELGLDWRENFTEILYEVQPRKIRIVAYWDEIERTKGVFDFSDLDWQMDRVAQEGIHAVLVIGMRVPRWPECHIPSWAQNEQAIKMQHALEKYMVRVIERYKHHSALAVWQLENEPFLSFGLCPKREKNFFERELALLKSLDSTHPVLVTDSGEFGAWHRAVREGDIFGTTIYRRVYPPSVGRFTGIIDYPIGPSFFRLREQIARFFAGEPDKPFVVIELQAEPWGMLPIGQLSYEEQVRIFPPAYFAETIQFAVDTGFSEYYLWGVEWWYAMRVQYGESRYWDTAAQLIRENDAF